jgi:hypothetical protein
MDEEHKAWEQLPGESSLWYGRFTRFKLMIFGRSVAAVFREEMRGNERNEPPGRWYEESKKWNWEARATEWDAFQTEETEKVIARERALVLRSGFALQHKRVLALDRLANKLIEMTEDEDKVWIPDVKAIGNGPGAERVDLVNFNAPLFTLIEKYQASIAAEMGERVKKTELTGKDGEVLQTGAVIYIPDNGRDPSAKEDQSQ